MFLGRGLHEWKGLALGLVILGCGIFIGDAYRSARDEELLRVSRVGAEEQNLIGATILLMTLKNHSAGCARTIIQDRVEQRLISAWGDSVPHPATAVDIELDRAIKLARQVLGQKDTSGVDLSQGCDEPEK
jgi:hypothetical protein